MKRRLLCDGRLFRQSDSAFERWGQVETLLLLFDNYRQFSITATNFFSPIENYS